MPVTDLALDCMAVARLIKLARDDSITDRMRERVIEWAYAHDADHVAKPDDMTWQELAKIDHHPPALARLLECWWCMGIHCAAVVVVLRSTRAGRPLRDLLAIAWAGSMLEEVSLKGKD